MAAKRVLGVEVPPLPAIPADPVPAPPRTPRRDRTLPGMPAPPANRPAPRATLQVEPEAPPSESARPGGDQPGRSITPPGHARVRGPGGWSASGPWWAVVLIVLIGVAGYVIVVELRAVKSEVQAIAKQQAERDARVDAVHKAIIGDPLEGKPGLVARVTALEHNDEVIAATTNKLGANLRFRDGPPSVEFHAPPLSARAAPVQPKDVLQRPGTP